MLVNNQYKCNKCKKTFSRKWNALRHNEKVHHNIASIYNPQTGFVFKHKYDIRSPYTKYNLYGYDKSGEHEEEIITNFYSNLIKPFEELESLYNDFPEHQRIRFVSDIFVASLSTSNPIKSLNDAVHFNRLINGKFKF